MHIVSNMFEPNGKKFASADVWGILYKSLKHNHKTIYDDDDDGDNEDEDEDEIFGVSTKLKDGCIYDSKDYRQRCLIAML